MRQYNEIHQVLDTGIDCSNEFLSANGFWSKIFKKQTPGTNPAAIVTCWHGGSKYHDGPCTVNEAQNGASTHYN